MNLIVLSPWDLAAAAVLVLALGLLSEAMRIRIGGELLVASIRTTVQLLLLGVVLKVLFARATPGWIVAMAAIMLIVAGWEVTRRQKLRLRGAWAIGIGSLSMFISGFSVTVFALLVMIGAEPWYAPQYSIPLLGMLLGNSMNGVSLSVNHLTTTASREKRSIEARLLLGQHAPQAMDLIRTESVRVGMVPIINAMMAAGIVSLPGMMTGQILAGAPPVEAVKYQILIMFLIAAVTGGASVLAVHLASRRLFDERQRLRLDRLERTGTGHSAPLFRAKSS